MLQMGYSFVPDHQDHPRILLLLQITVVVLALQALVVVPMPGNVAT